MRQFKISEKAISVLCRNRFLTDKNKVYPETMWPQGIPDIYLRRGLLIEVLPPVKYKVGVVVPTRGNRGDFLKHSLFLLENQTLKPDLISIVDHEPKDDRIDIIPRYIKGCKYLFKEGCDVVLFWEDDDWYARNYIEEMINGWASAGKPEIFGIGYTYYYHLFEKKYLRIDHKGRASAYSTLVTKRFNSVWFRDYTDAYIDTIIWKQMKGKTFEPKTVLSLGIKHNLGMVGGGAHNGDNAHYKHNDHECKFFKSVVGEDYLFYSKIIANGKRVHI